MATFEADQPAIHPSSPEYDDPKSTYHIGTRLELKRTTPPVLSVSVEISAHLRVEFGRRTQVVVVIIRNDLRSVDSNFALGQEIVAKIYDPVYDVEGRTWPMGASYATYWTKENETKAYNKLKELQGLIVPKFLGEAICSLPMGKSQGTRNVSVLLLSLEKLTPLSDYIDPWTDSREALTFNEKEALKAAMISAFQKLHQRCVYHGDIEPHNLLWEYGKLRILDFGHAETPDEEDLGRQYLELNDEALITNVLEMFGIETPHPSLHSQTFAEVVP